MFTVINDWKDFVIYYKGKPSSFLHFSLNILLFTVFVPYTLLFIQLNIHELIQ